jgi:hypothetical protein
MTTYRGVDLDRYRDELRQLQTQQVTSAYELSPLPEPETKDEAEEVVRMLVVLADCLREDRKGNGFIRETYPGQPRLKQVALGYRRMAHKWDLDFRPFHHVARIAPATATRG